METTPITEMEKTADLEPLYARRGFKALVLAEKSEMEAMACSSNSIANHQPLYFFPVGKQSFNYRAELQALMNAHSN